MSAAFPGLLCLAGTRLATPSGTATVEALRIGDALATPDGPPCRVNAIGRVVLFPAEVAARPADWPVRLCRGALGDNLPDRDLLVPPGQRLSVAGFPSVAAWRLVNGVSLQRDLPEGRLDLFDVQLDRPAIVLVHGLELAPSPTAPDPPTDDASLLRLRAHLATRAGLRSLLLRGAVDTASPIGLAGWAVDAADPDRPVVLELMVNGVAGELFAADRHRADLERAGIGNGRCAFKHLFATPLDATRLHLIRIRRAVDGQELPGSPVLLDRHVAPDFLLAELDPALAPEMLLAAVRSLGPRLGR